MDIITKAKTSALQYYNGVIYIYIYQGSKRFYTLKLIQSWSPFKQNEKLA